MGKLLFYLMFLGFIFCHPKTMDHKDKKKDRIIRKLELIEFLDLSEEQAEKFFVKFGYLAKS